MGRHKIQNSVDFLVFRPTGATGCIGQGKFYDGEEQTIVRSAIPDFPLIDAWMWVWG